MNKDNQYFGLFRTAVDTVWGRKVIAAFLEERNKIEKVLKVLLSVPTIEFTLNKHELGSWTPSTKTLTLSYHLLDKYEWDSVLHVLRHEMAHMITTEIWGDVSDNGRHHGELFAKACNIMGIPADRTFDPGSDEISEKEKLVTKVQKLFALGESNFEAEAKVAVRKAYELMAKHNISSVELPEAERKFVFRPVGEVYQKTPHYVKKLAGIMMNSYFVKCIFSYIYHEGTPYKYLEMYGEPHNVDVAEYVYHFLLAEGERQWDLFKVGVAGRGYSKHAFLEGFYSGFYSTLKQQKEEALEAALTSIASENTLPVSIDDPLLDEKYRQQYPSARKTHSRSGAKAKGRSVGHEKGRSVTIRQGVSQGGSSRLQLT